MSITPDARNFGLDAIRATAIVLVLVAHGSQFIAPNLLSIGISPDEFSSRCGVVGVELFFCLSGYLIGNILLQLANEGPSVPQIKIFLVRRWLRTLPAYFVILLLLILFPRLDPAHRANVAPYFVMMQNMFRPMPNSNWFGTSWSLVIEEWSYLILPLLAFGLFRNRDDAVLKAAVLLCLAAFLVRAANIHGGIGWDRGIRKLGVARFDALSYGVIFAYLYGRWREQITQWCYRLAPISIFFLSYVIWNFGSMTALGDFYSRLFALPFFSVLTLTLFPIAMSLRRPAFGIVVSFIAQISYSLYLVHWSIMHLTMSGSQSFALFIAGSLLAATVLSFFIEQPIMRMRPGQWSAAHTRAYASV